MRNNLLATIPWIILTGLGVGLEAQSTLPASTPEVHTSQAELERRVDELSQAIDRAQRRLAESQTEILALQTEVGALHVQMARAGAGAADAPGQTATEEREQALENAVALHDQIKVESKSKYPLRVTGLILFNGYVNEGVPDNSDIPEVAGAMTTTSGEGSVGGSFRQTILGLEGDGPRVFGAHTSASVAFDFFSGITDRSYGTSAGIVRMRTASINFDWPHDSLSVGMAAPLISPLSPSSYATVAEPALAGAGNLWTWAPQLRYRHRMPLPRKNELQLELGLLDAAAAGYSSSLYFRNASPGELSKQPGYETRVSYLRPGDRGLQLGASGYYSRESYPAYGGYRGKDGLDSWAGAFDIRLPFARHFEVSGEGYRGRALGGLGGGVYKNVVIGTKPVLGESVLHGLNAIGGWSQLKTRFSPTLESNLSIGLDDGLARDFHAVTLPPGASATQLRARNKMVIGNLIFKPKTYIILSPEYRRIWTWPISGPANTVDIFTLAVGYQF